MVVIKQATAKFFHLFTSTLWIIIWNKIEKNKCKNQLQAPVLVLKCYERIHNKKLQQSDFKEDQFLYIYYIACKQILKETKFWDITDSSNQLLCNHILGFTCVPNLNDSGMRVRVMVFKPTIYNNSAISWRSVLLVEETGILGKNHWPVASHWQTCFIEYTLPRPGFELTTWVMIDTNCTGRCKFNYHTITTSIGILHSHYCWITNTMFIQCIIQRMFSSWRYL